VSISVSTPNSSVDPYVELRNASDGNLASDSDGGPGADSLISGYQIPSTGTYYARVGKNYWSSARGNYEVRVQVSRGIPMETDAQYHNDSLANADGISLVDDGTSRNGVIAGLVQGSEGSNHDEDRFNLGLQTAGNAVELDLRLPAFSTLDGQVRLLDSNGTLVEDTDGDSTDGHFLATLAVDGVYYAEVRANSGAGVLGAYILDVSVFDAVAPRIQYVSRLPLPLPGSDAYRDGILSGGPSVYLRLNEASGAVLADSSGHADGPHDGSVVGTPTYAQTGPFGASGDTGLGVGGDAHIEIPDGDRVDATRGVSFSFWMNVDSFANTWMPLVFKGTTNSNQRSYSLWLNSGGYLGFSTSDSSGQEWHQTSGGLIGTNQWYHVAGAVDRDSGRLKLWVNGVERIDAGIRTNDILTNDNPLLLGHTQESSGSYAKFDGTIDEFALWTEARTSKQLLAPYFDSKWKGDPQSSDVLMSTFSFQVSEKLIGRSVNYQNWEFATFGGHTYVKLGSQTWASAQAWAEGEGGYLAVPDSAEENTFLWETFSDPPNHDLWIGLTDEPTQVPEASEGVWKTVQGVDPTYDNWSGSEPNGGDNYDYAYLHYGNGQWYDGWHTWNKQAVAEFDDVTDTDGDGIPDVIDWRAEDASNGLEIRQPGADGIFDEGDDDVVYDARASYDGNVTVSVTIADGPLGPGEYRLTVTDAVTDLVGNPLDGDGDHTPGGDFVQFFAIDPLPPGSVIERAHNNGPSSATPLTLVQDSVEDSVLYTEMFGIGSQDPADYRETWSDPDYWSFEAQAGDHVSISVSTPNSGVNPYVELRNASDGNLASDSDGGPGADSLISGYQIPSTGTYYARVGKDYWSSARGNYEVRVQVSRGIPMETDAQYHNDSLANADGMTLVASGTSRSGAIAGVIQGSEGSNHDEDRFNLGLQTAGNTIELTVQLPDVSTLDASVGLLDSIGEPLVDEDGDPTDGHFLATLTDNGIYYADVRANSGAGVEAFYVLEATVTDTAAPRIESVSRLPLPLPGSDAYRDSILSGGPSVYLRLNEASGAVLADSSGHADGPHDGSVVGTPTYAQTGPFGASGDTGLGLGSDAYIEIAHGDRVDATRGISFSLWMNVNSFANAWMPVVYKGLSDGTRSYSLWLHNTGHLWFGSSDGSGSQNYTTGNGVVGTNQWYHVAGVVDRDTGRLKLWVNGVKHIDGAIRTDDIVTNSSPLLLGHTLESNSSYSDFEGTIDEFALWTEARTSNQMLASYFDSKWKGDTRSSDVLLSTFSFTVSEKLISRSVNHQNWELATFGGHTYVKLGSRSWASAQAWAVGEGGYLAVPDSVEENTFLWETFSDPPNHDLWIGLTDEPTQVPEASEGVWKTVHGVDPTYDNWSGSEPNSGNGYDYAYLHYGNGQWYDGHHTWNKQAVVEFDDDTDTDGDGIPDAIDWRAEDALNGLEIREAGADGIFDEGDDDVVYDARASYDGNVTVSVTIVDGPLGPGEYRLTITDAVTDLVGNPLDGDGDHTPGGDFVQFFTISIPDAFTPEGPHNHVLGNATPLTLIEDPMGSGLFTTDKPGLGSQDPAPYRNWWGDPDYWSFQAQLGDRVAIAIDTPTSGMNPYVELRNASDQILGGSSPDGASDDDGGPGADSYISHFTIPADGTYYVRVGKSYWSSARGNYQVRVDLARGIDLESDAQYNNDSVGGADPINFTTIGSQRLGTIGGTVMAGESGNVDEDYFNLGTVESGETILLSIRLPGSSELRPVVEIRDANNNVVSIATNPVAAVARADISVPGPYYAVVIALDGQGIRGQYLLEAAIQPTDELDFADLSVTGVQVDPPSAASGQTVRVTWEVGNFGAVPTAVSDWVDRVILSPVGGGLDPQVWNVAHSGALGVDEETNTYQAQADLVLPVGISGDYRFCVHTDAGNDVREFIFEDNNVTCSEIVAVWQPVQVTSVDPEGITSADVTAITLELSGPVVGDDARNPSTYELLDFGGDREPGGDDDQPVLVNPSYTDGSSEILLSFDTLSDGVYQFSATSGDPGLRDLLGVPIDGDGDGGAGGNFVSSLVVDRIAPTVADVTISSSQIAITYLDSGGMDPDSVQDVDNYTLVRSGGDGVIGNDDVVIDLTAAVESIDYTQPSRTALIDFKETLPDDLYQLTINGTSTVQDLAGHPLAGGDYVADLELWTGPATVTLDLKPGSDTGASDSDNLTSDDASTYDVAVNKPGQIQVDFDGDDTYEVTQTAPVADTYTFTSTSLADGTYQVKAGFTPAVGSAVEDTLPVTIDTVAPGAVGDLAFADDNGVSGTDGLTSDDTPTFSWTAPADPSGIWHYEYRVDGGAWATVATPAVTVPLGAGPHSFHVRAVDNAGLVGPEDSIGLTLELTPPAQLGGVTMTEDTGSASDDAVTSDPTPTFAWDAAADPDFWKYQYQLDAGAWTDTGDPDNPVVTLSPADGAHTFRVRSKDTAGNAGQASEPFDFRIDTRRPSAPGSVSVDEDTGASASDLITSDTTPRASWPAVNDPSGIWRYEYQVDGAGWTEVTQQWVDLNLPVGDRVFDVRAVDHAGNVGTARSATIVVDTELPSVLSHEPSGTVHEPVGYVDVTFDDLIDQATLDPELYYEGTPVADPGFAVSPRGGGIYRIAFTPQMQNGQFRLVVPATVTDVAGNPMGTAYDATFEQAVVDLIAVSITPEETELTYGQTVQVSWTGKNDPNAGEATGSWWDFIYLSDNDELDQDDIQLDSWSRQGPLPAGETYTDTAQVTLPLDSSYTPGEKYLIFDLDFDGDIDLTNNTAVSEVVNLGFPPMPDLAVSGIGATPPLIAGQQAAINWWTENYGDAAVSGTWREAIYVSDDLAVGDDVHLGFVEFDGTIPAGDSVARNAEVTIPQSFAETGIVYFVVATDTTNQVVESDETNNAGISASSYHIANSLAISASAAEVWETAGDNTLRLVVTRSGSTQQSLEVELESSDVTEVVVPAAVIIPASQPSKAFFVEIRDDTIVDPSQVVTITATATDFESDNVQVGILDNETPTLAIELDPVSMNEGDTASCIVSRSYGKDDDPSYMTEEPLTVTLKDVTGGQYSLPETVEIPAGSLVGLPFDVTATQDEVPELETCFRIEATATGYVRGTACVTLLDDDLPSLEIFPAWGEVSDGAGATALTAIVRRAEATGGSLTVRLSSSDETAALVESEAVIAAGETETTFTIGAVDDDFVDGTQSVVISAVGVIPSCGCEAPNPGGTATADVDVLDDDGPTLKVVFDRELVPEGVPQAATLTVSRNVDPIGDLEVTLTSSDTDGSELIVPGSVIISHGQVSASFDVSSVEDNVNDGNQTVTVTASAEGFVQGLGSIVVSDVDLPDLKIVSVEGPPVVSTEAWFNISYRMENLGLSEAVGSNADPENDFPGSWTQRVFLSSDPYVGSDVLTGQYTFEGTMPEGSQWGFERTVPARAPTAPGDYYLIVQTDVTSTVTEGLESNNVTISAEPVTVQPAYSAYVETDLEQGAVGLSVADITPVQMSGEATNTDGSPAQFVPVSIHIKVRDTERVIAAVTDQLGNYSTTWRPLPGEGGRYTIGACHPGLDTAPVQDEFVLMGMKVVPTSRSVYVVEGETGATSFTIHNLADVPVTGLSLTLDNVPENLEVTTTDLEGQSIEALGSIPLDVSVHAIDATYTSGSFTMRIDSAEGAAVQMPVHVRIEPLVARLSAEPGSLGGGMLRGSERVVEFAITNTGGLETGLIQVLLPETDWLSLATEAEMGSLEPGESSMVSLVLRPPAEMALGNHTGNVTLNFTGNHLSVPFSFRALSDQQGDLEILVVDEHYFFTEEKPALAGARVRVTDALSGAEVFNGEADANGQVTILDLREGYYQIVCRAKDHETYNKTLLIEADKMNTVRAFLPLQTVRATWTVVETEIEDHYEIVIETVFETNVPAPVVTVTPGQLDLSPLTAPGQTMQVNFTIENHGLIQTEGTELSFGDHVMYDIRPLVEDIGILPAKSSVTVPVIVERLEYNESALAAGELEPANGATCHIPGGVVYVYICDGQNYRRIPITVSGIDVDCGGTGTPWGGWPVGPGGGGWSGPGGGGGPSGPGTVYTTTPSTSDDTCDPCINEAISALLCWIPGGCLAGAAVTCGSGEIEDIVTGRNDNTWQDCLGGSLQGCLIGLIPGYGTAINCIIAAGQLMACLLGNAMGPQSLGGEITPSGDDHGGMADFTWGGESILPTEIPYLNFDNLDVSWAGDLEEVIETWLTGMGWGLTALEPLAYVFGNSAWMYDFGHDPLQEAMTTFLDATYTTTEEGYYISADEQAGIISTAVGYEMPQDVFEAIVARWNRTMQYWDAGWYTTADVPAGQSTDFIDAEILHNKFRYGQQAMLEVQEAGYADPTEVVDTSHQILQDVIDEIDGAGVCAQVKLQIKQEAVITRDAFEATLELENSTTGALEDVSVEILITNDQGHDITDLFGIYDPEVVGFTPANSPWTLAAQSTGVADWLIVPTTEVAPEGATVVFVGAILEYTDQGREVTMPLEAVPITVYPQPELDLKYFHQRDVFSDDPWTEPVEPAQPFELAVMIRNFGAGEARDLQITSAQPEIIENERGLLIDFKIIASQLDGQPMTPSLTMSFGTIDPGATSIGRWFLTSTLQGHFVDYDATFQHIDGLGDPRLSLIKSVEIYEMIHAVYADGPFDDGLSDFLTNEVPDAQDLPDTLHLSDGTVRDVALADEEQATVAGALSPANFEVTLTAQMPEGFGYLRMTDRDPGGGDYGLVSVVRTEDGTELPTENFWQTDRRFIGLGQRPKYEDSLHLFDHNETGGPVSYVLTYVPLDQSGPRIEELAGPPAFTEDNVDEVTVTFNELLKEGTFDWADMGLTRDGGAIALDDTVTAQNLGEGVYRVSGLSSWTDLPGVYRFTVDASGVEDVFSNPSSGSEATEWTRATLGPWPESVTGADPFVRDPVNVLQIDFSEAVDANTLGVDDVTLLHDGVEVELTVANEFFSEVAPDVFEIRGLADKTVAEGEYEFTIDALGIADPEGDFGNGTATLNWTMDTTPPDVTEITGTVPDLVAQPVNSFDVRFSEALADGYFTDAGGLTLLRNDFEDIDLSNAQIVALPGNNYQVSGLRDLAAEDGVYVVTFDLTSICDRAGNPGVGIAQSSWTLDSTAPAAPSDLAITPDNGDSGTDGVTDTTQVSLTGTLAEAGLAVVVYNAPSGGVAIGEADVTDTSFSVDLSLVDGWNNLRVSASDAAGNISASFFDVFCDTNDLFIADVAGLPDGASHDAVTELWITFSNEIAPSTLIPEVMTLTGAGEVLSLDGVIIEPVAEPDNAYRLADLPAAPGVYGAYALTIDLTQVEKQSSGRTGAAPYVLQWSVIPVDETFPQVTSVVVQNGETAPEAVERMDVNFSEPIQLAGMVADGSVAAAVLLARVDAAGQVLAHVPLMPGEFSADATSTRLTWQSSAGPLPGGRYVLQLRAEDFQDEAGNPLDGQGSQDRDIGMTYFAGETQVEADGGPIVVQQYSVPALAEMTGDDLPELLVGEKMDATSGRVSIYRNTAAGFAFESYALDHATGDPLILPATGCLGVSVRGVDFNDDGSMDLLLGQADGAVKIALGAGDPSGVRFHAPGPVVAGPGDLPIDVGDRAVVEFTDFDNDGHLDLIAGALDGNVRWYRNTGTVGSPSFAAASLLRLRSGAEIVVPSDRSAPAIADVTGDGRTDLLCGNTAGQVWLYANVGSNSSPAYVEGVQLKAAGEKIDLAGNPRSRVFIGDATGDGRTDLLVGSEDGSVRLYEGQAATDAAEAEFLVVSLEGPSSLDVGQSGEWTVAPYDEMTSNEWDFDDGWTVADLETHSHAYDVEGDYDLVVTVAADQGALTAAVTKPVAVTPRPVTTIGDRVWLDANADGIQDAGEVGFANVNVTLYRESGEFVADTTTDVHGLYRFDEPDVAAGLSYFLEFARPAGYGFSPQDQGSDGVDSDPDLDTGMTAALTAVAGANLGWDAGLVELGSIGGIVWNDTDGDKEKGDQEDVLPGRIVYLDTIQNGVKDLGEPQRETDAGGRYLFENLRPGSYVVRHVLDGWMATHPDEAGASELAQPTLSEGPSPQLFLPGELVPGEEFTPAADLVNLDDFRADPRFASLDGSPLSVVVIDTGIDPDHPFFGPDNDGDGVADRIVFQYDFADDDADARAVSAHGSHVSSIIASEDATYGGIAPGADLIHLKVFTDRGRGYFTYLERALGWVYEHAAEYNVAAVNLSLGDTQNWTAAGGHYGLADELAALAALDVIVVSAAGNRYGYFDSQTGVAYPAADPNSLAVGAVWDSDRGGPWSFGEFGTDYTTDADRITSFSQRHDALLDAFAPGALITGANAAGGVTAMRGTSMAAPHVTGAAVLAQQVALTRLGRPLTPSEFRDLLSASNTSIFDGDDEDDSVTNTDAFYGRLDVHALADAVWNYEPSGGNDGGDHGGDNGDGDVGTLNGVPYAYTIELGPGQHRLDVDFGTRPDETPPELTVPLDATLEAPAADTGPDATGHATAADNWDPSPTVTYSDDVLDESYVQIVITRTWTATDQAGNSVSADQVITVLDTTPPTVTAPADVMVEPGQSTDPAHTGEATAADSWDPSPTVTYSDSGTDVITRTWTATDAAGNSASDVQMVVINFPPELRFVVLDAATPGTTATGLPEAANLHIVEDHSFFGEIWVRSNQDGPQYIAGGTVDLGFDPNYAEIVAVESLNANWTSGNDGVVGNDAGTLTGLTRTADTPALGDDEWVLFARVELKGKAPVDEVNHVFGPYDMALDVTDAELTVSGYSRDAQIVQQDGATSYCVIFDVDDSGRVVGGDFGLFSAAYRGTVGDPEPPYYTWADFDGSGGVRGGDFGFFSGAYRKWCHEIDFGHLPERYRPAGWTEGASVRVQQAGGAQSIPVDGDLTVEQTRIIPHIFYNNSAFDGNDPAADTRDDAAIAPDKEALLPGETATFQNYTSYSRGINGIMFDFDNLPGTPTADDFQFKVGNTLTPDSWTAAPAPAELPGVREVDLDGDGTPEVERVTITWADGAISGQWLQVTVKATENTGLARNHVFYYGNAVGESLDSPTSAFVDGTDFAGTRDNTHDFLNPAPIDDAYDYNRDSLVDALDLAIARDNQTNFVTALKLITAPASEGLGASAPSRSLISSSSAPALQLSQVSSATDDNVNAPRPISGADWPINTSVDPLPFRPTTRQPADVPQQRIEDFDPKTVSAVFQDPETAVASDSALQTTGDRWANAVDDFFQNDDDLLTW